MLTEPEEWRFVPGKLNPADEATRSVIKEESLSLRWLKGPKFLFKPESEWPKDLPWIAVPDEMRACRTYATQLTTDVSIGPTFHCTNPTSQNSSSWRAPPIS